MDAISAASCLLVTLFALVATTGAAQQTQRGSIEGVVLDSVTGQPVSDAIVEVTGIVEGRVRTYTDTTSRDGGFSIKDIPAGEGYAVVATHGKTHLPAQYGQRRPMGPGVPISLAPGTQMKDLRIELTPTSSISGRVMDSNGLPLSNVRVTLIVPDYRAGLWVAAPEDYLSLMTNTTSMGYQTNSRGEYRISGLNPGQYYLRATPRGERNQTPLAVYFPGTLDPQLSSPIDIPLAEDLRVPDFTMDLRIAGAQPRRLTGTVVDSAGNPLSEAVVSLASANRSSESLLWVGQVQNPNGAFAITNVPPGSYVLLASTTGGATRQFGSVPIDVGRGNIENVSVRLAPGFGISARISIEGRTTSAPMTELRRFAITLEPTPAAFGPISASPGEDGRLLLEGLAPWGYRVTISPQPRDAYVKSVRLGEIDVLRNGLHLTGKPANELEIVLATDFCEIDGVLFDSDKQPAPLARVVLLPEKTLRNYSGLSRVGMTNDQGQFQIQGLPPGNYKLFSWEKPEGNAWQNPEFLRLYEDRGTAVHLDNGRREEIEMTVLPPWVKPR